MSEENVYAVENVNSSELEHEKALKEEKKHKPEEHLGEMGAVAFPLDEKHEAKKDPEHADWHKIEEGLSSTTSTGGAVIHEMSGFCYTKPGGRGVHIHVTASHPKGGISSVGGTFRVEKEETKKEAEEAEGNHEKKETKKEAE